MKYIILLFIQWYFLLVYSAINMFFLCTCILCYPIPSFFYFLQLFLIKLFFVESSAFDYFSSDSAKFNCYIMEVIQRNNHR